MESRVQQSEQHRFVGEQPWEHEDLETSSYRGCIREGKEQKREVCGYRSVGDLRAQSREEGFEQLGKCRHQRPGVASSNAQGQARILPFHVCIRPWKLHPSGKWLNGNSLTSLSLQVVFIALLPCSFSRTARFTAHPTIWGWYASGGV